MTTKNNYGFKSVFADEMTAYVDSKVAGGFKARSFTVNLRKFDKYCCGIHLSDKTFTASDASGLKQLRHIIVELILQKTF